MRHPNAGESRFAISARTEELLYVLLWGADVLMNPTWRNMNNSFEQWAWRNHLTHRLAQLENAKLLERHPRSDLTRVVRLTEEGRLLALGGRDPIRQWSRPWDGTWRLVLFDLPVQRTDLRQRLLRALRRNHFGYLQNSVWITPDAALAVRAKLLDEKREPDSLLILEGRPAAGESDAEMVRSAWDFGEIDRRYEQHMQWVKQGPPGDARLVPWAARELALWKAAMRLDPLLPLRLLPPHYRGQRALELRRKLLARLK
jgi:DNA-binding transcriptional regulator PaaX